MHDKTSQRYQSAIDLIPGGGQLLSKRPEIFAPAQWPAYFSRAAGCEIWDLDGRHYYDFSHNNVGACLLGYAHPDITQAVMRVIKDGCMSSLNPPEEVELAEQLLAIHPWAENARFTRAGGESMAVAVRIARATTDRSAVAIAGYHGWHDWYLAANLGDNDALRGMLLPGLEPRGVPRELRGTAIPFDHGDPAAFDAVMEKHGRRLAAVVMEPCRHHTPPPGYLEHVRARTQACGALLIFDEITIGWRMYFGGVHMMLGVHPDIAVFAKALGNGHPIGAVIGTRAAMAGAHSSFISSTFWTERVGPAAALAVLRQMRETDVPAHVSRIGKAVQEIWRQAARKHGVPASAPDAFACLAQLTFENDPNNIMRTLFTQEMLAQGFLAGAAFYPTMAHTPELVDKYAAAIDAVFGKLAAYQAAGHPEKFLHGPPAHGGFKRLVK